MNDIGDTDALAAEYVLGTLDFAEREQARSLLSLDVAFAAKVKLWERRLGELHLMVEPVEPDPRLRERIRAKLPAPEPDLQPKPTEADPAEVDAAETDAVEVDAAEVEAAEVDAADANSTEVNATEVAPSETAAVAPTPAPGDLSASDLPSPTIVPEAGSDVAPAGAPEPADLREPPVSPPEVPPQRTLIEPALSPSAAPSPAQAAVPVSREGRAWPAQRENAALRRRLASWRVLAVVMMILVLAVAGLLAAWRWLPDRVPTALQPAELMRLVGVELPSPESPPRPATPPESEFEE